MYAKALGSKGLFTSTPTLTTGTASMALYEALVRDQGQTSGCEGASSAQAAWMAFAATPTPLAWFPSEDGLYRDARCQERSPNADGSLPPLTDSGAMTSDVVTIFQTCGLRKSTAPAADGRNSDLDTSTVNDEPTLDQADTEAETPVLVDPGSFIVDLSNTVEALAVVQSALKLNLPVRMDIIVDSAFQDYFQTWTPSTPPLDTCNPNDPTAGGHATVMSGLVVNSTSDGVIDGLNSWGSIGAPPIVQEGLNRAGHWQATFNWFKLAVQQITIWKCSRVPS